MRTRAERQRQGMKAVMVAVVGIGFLGALEGLRKAEAAPQRNCISCSLVRASSVMPQLDLSSGVAVLAVNVASVVNRFNSPTRISRDQESELPGAFKAPWSFPDTNFDPTFKQYDGWDAGPGVVFHAPVEPRLAPLSRDFFAGGLSL